MKENSNRNLIVRLPETLSHKFRKVCSGNYKTMSEATRDLIQEYIKRNSEVDKKEDHSC